MLKLSQLEELLEIGRELQEQLRQADHTLAAFEAIEGPTVPCRAITPSSFDVGYRRVATAVVDLLPVPKEQAISAAIRARSKIVQELANLGIEVDSPPAAAEVVLDAGGDMRVSSGPTWLPSWVNKPPGPGVVRVEGLEAGAVDRVARGHENLAEALEGRVAFLEPPGSRDHRGGV